MPDDHTPPPADSHAEPPAGAAATLLATRSSWLVPAIVIIALLVILVTLNLRKGSGGKVSPEAIGELQAEAQALREQLNRERMALGLRPLEGNVESMQDIAARLRKDADTMVALASSFQTMLAEKDAEISAKNTELIRSEQLRQTLAAESARLNGELQRSVAGGAETESLRREIAALKQQRDVLTAQLDQTRQELAANTGGISAEIHADLQRRLEEITRARDFFEARAGKLEGQLSKAKLFAKNDNELLPEAVELVRGLRKLEGKSDSEISSAYSSLGVELGASVLHTLNFNTGSSDLNAADEEIIRKLLDEIPDGDMLLAVGYASETGDVEANQDLSSARATAAASHCSAIKRPGQVVQAVYLGQTDRFSSKIPESNQIVELWRIRKP